MKVSVKHYKGVKQTKLWDFHTDIEAEKENVENNSLLKHVPEGRPGPTQDCHHIAED